MRRRAGLLLVVAFTASGCFVHGSHDAVRPEPVGRWRALPPPPLPATARALGLSTGREVVYLGGDRRPCPPRVSCDAAELDPQGPGRSGMTRQAAAYDVRTGTWRRLAPAPAYVDADTEAAYAAGRIIVDTAGGWFVYDLGHDTWTAFRSRWARNYGLSPVGDVIFGESRDLSRVVAYDARARRWTTYPRDTLRPRLGEATVSGTPSGPVLAGYDKSRPYDIHRGSPAIADVWDHGRWRRLPPSGQMERGWTWTGKRLVDPTRGFQDRGDEYTWPRAYPFGGILDPGAGRWQPLPTVLERAPQGWVTTSSGWPGPPNGSGWFATDGRVYDDRTGDAWPLPRPAGAPEVYASAVWVDGRLVAFGGASYSGQHLTLGSGAWIYTP